MEPIIISLCISAFSILINLLLQFFFQIKLLKSNIIPQKRQEWINQVRETVSSILSLSQRAKYFLHNNNYSNNKEFDECRESLIRYISLLKLLLNPNEEVSNSLLAKIENYSLYNKPDDNNILQREVINLCQKILKTEWDRIKQLK